MPARPTATAEESPRIGRPRSEDRTPAILTAAKQLLEEVGYDHLKIQDVADRAGAGLATLYRRWPTKQALIADAIRFHSEVMLPPPDDDPETDLLNVYRAMGQKLCGDAQVLPGLLAALRTDPELAEVVRCEVLTPMRERTRADLVKILGEDNPRIDLLVDLGPGLLLYRKLMFGEDSDEESFPDILDLIARCQ